MVPIMTLRWTWPCKRTPHKLQSGFISSPHSEVVIPLFDWEVFGMGIALLGGTTISLLALLVYRLIRWIQRQRVVQARVKDDEQVTASNIRRRRTVLYVKKPPTAGHIKGPLAARHNNENGGENNNNNVPFGGGWELTQAVSL